MLYGPAAIYLETQRTYAPNWFASFLTLITNLPETCLPSHRPYTDFIRFAPASRIYSPLAAERINVHGPLQTDTTIFIKKNAHLTFCKWSPIMQNKYNYANPASAMEVGWIMDLDQYLEKMDTTTTFILIQPEMLYGPAILYLKCVQNMQIFTKISQMCTNSHKYSWKTSRVWKYFTWCLGYQSGVTQNVPEILQIITNISKLCQNYTITLGYHLGGGKHFKISSNTRWELKYFIIYRPKKNVWTKLIHIVFNPDHTSRNMWLPSHRPYTDLLRFAPMSLRNSARVCQD